MKRYRLGIILFAVLGLAFVTGCGDNGGGGGGLPKSEALYEGQGMPSVIDSTTHFNFYGFAWHIYSEMFITDGMMSSLAYTFSDASEEKVLGSISGYYIDWWNKEEYASTTRGWVREKEGRTYSAYANSTEVLRGEGNSYYYHYYEETTNGAIPNGLSLLSIGPIGLKLTMKHISHENYSAFFESTDSAAMLQGGWMTLSENSFFDTTEGIWTRSLTGRANYGENDLANDEYWALLGAEANVAWDGSQTTYTASGTYCTEGTDSPFEGCTDFDFDLTFECEFPWDCAPAGIQTVSTETVSAEFTFNGTFCYDIKVDIGRDGSWDFTKLNFCPPL